MLPPVARWIHIPHVRRPPGHQVLATEKFHSWDTNYGFTYEEPDGSGAEVQLSAAAMNAKSVSCSVLGDYTNAGTTRLSRD
jgi:hypothetical protein